MSRLLFMLLGWFFFTLGLIGVFLPVLPTTPFMLLALWAFSRSSWRFHNWLHTHPIFGPPLQRWNQYGVIPRSAKWFALGMMAASLSYLFIFAVVHLAIKLVALAVMAFGAWFILTRPSQPPKGE